jgi:hypothetical protein
MTDLAVRRRPFYLVMSVLLAGIAVYGFSHTVPGDFVMPGFAALLWVHGGVFTAWLVLCIAQPALYAFDPERAPPAQSCPPQSPCNPAWAGDEAKVTVLPPAPPTPCGFGEYMPAAYGTLILPALQPAIACDGTHARADITRWWVGLGGDITVNARPFCNGNMLGLLARVCRRRIAAIASA